MASNSSTTPSFESRAELIPWDWYIKPNTPDSTCPPPSAILGTFAIVTISVSLLNLIFGNRLVVNKLTCGLLGKPAGKSWWFMFLVPLGTQLGANAFVAYMYTTTPGYAEGFGIVEMMLFYTIRPRMGWIVLIVTMHFGRRFEKGFQELPRQRRESMTSGSRTEEDMELISSHYQNEELDRTVDGFNESKEALAFRSGVVLENGWYEASAKGAIIAEIFLLIIGSYYNGRTVHFATRNGYYLISHLKGPHAHYARIMYVGALLSLIFLFTAIVYLCVKIADNSSDGATEGIVVAYIVGVTTWLGSWLFWAGYVHLAGDLYCPPKLIESGAIWTTFSIIGTFFGGGF